MVFSFRFWWLCNFKHTEGVPMAQLFATEIYTTIWTLPPANRIGYTVFTLPQLKVLQEVISLSVFVPFSIFYMGVPVKLDYLWAGLCLMGAVYFMFR